MKFFVTAANQLWEKVSAGKRNCTGALMGGTRESRGNAVQKGRPFQRRS